MTIETEYGFASRMLKAVMDGNEQALYDVTMRGDTEHRFFSRYRDGGFSIGVANEDDPEQMYFKGLFDGMRLCFVLMEQIYENMEEDTNE